MGANQIEPWEQEALHRAMQALNAIEAELAARSAPPVAKRRSPRFRVGEVVYFRPTAIARAAVLAPSLLADLTAQTPPRVEQVGRTRMRVVRVDGHDFQYPRRQYRWLAVHFTDLQRRRSRARPATVTADEAAACRDRDGEAAIGTVNEKIGCSA